MKTPAGKENKALIIRPGMRQQGDSFWFALNHPCFETQSLTSQEPVGPRQTEQVVALTSGSREEGVSSEDPIDQAQTS